MADTVVSLRREIALDLEIVSKNLENKYVKHIPQFSSSLGDAASLLEDLSNKISDKLVIVDGFINEQVLSNVADKQKSLKKEVNELKDSKELIEKLGMIESHISSLYFSDKEIATEAQIINECMTLLQEIPTDHRGSILTERIRSMLSQEIRQFRSVLFGKLGEDFKEFVSFPTCSTKGVTLMKISNETTTGTSAFFSAMDTISYFDGKVGHWTSEMMKHFCKPIIDSRDGLGVFELESIKTGVYLFKSTSKNMDSRKDINVHGVLDTLAKFFSAISNAIVGTTVGTESLSKRLGKLLEKDLMNAIIKDCISLAVPFCDQNDASYGEAMNLAEEFRKHMINLEFWNEAVPTFAVFAEANERVFIDRRCLALFMEGKKLVQEPFTDLEEVGGTDEITKEVIDDYVAAFNTPVPNLSNQDETYPTMMKLLKCKVSKPIIEFVKLIEKMLTEAVSTDNEMLRGRLALTVQNLLQFYSISAHKTHSTVISSVPQAAATFYNNCYYICHRLIVLPMGVLSNLKEDSAKCDVFRPIAVENVFTLRENAAAALEEMMMQCRRQLSTLFVDRQMFTGLDNYERLRMCEKTIKGSTMLVKSIADVWKDVLSESVYCNALGNIVGYLLNDLISMFLECEDIRSNDAELAAPRLLFVLKELEELFVIRGASVISVSCESAYYRTQEVVHCLNGSLKGIDSRWCDGKGPLAQWMTPNEVRSLVKALFMNTEQRKRLLESIG